MYHRIFDIENRLDEAMFLFGGRQVGKSTLLKERFPKAVYFDLLNSELRNRFRQHPEVFRESLLRYPPETLVIVDEIQKVPDLLDEVHWLMVNKGLFFILSGSSARKLKKSGANNLGGRAIPETLFPLVSAEIPDYDLERAVQNGMIPRHYMVANARNRLKSYIELYMKDEIIEEAGIAKGTFYYYFESKELLLEEVICMMINKEAEKAAEVLKSDLPVPVKITGIIMSLQPAKEEFTIEEALLSPENALMHKKIKQKLYDVATPILSEVVEEGIKEGIFDCNNIPERVKMMLLVSSEVFDDGHFTERDIEVFIDLTEKLLGARKGTMEFVRDMIVRGE